MKLLNKLNKIVWGFAILIATIICWWLIFHNQVIARAPEFKEDFSSYLTKSGSYVINNSNISSENSLRKNIEALFYPWGDGEDENMIFKVIRDLTLWIMIVYIVWAWATLLFNRKSEDLQKTLWSIIYVLIWWCFIYLDIMKQ